MESLDQHFQHFLRERIYLHDVAIDLALSSAALTCRSSSFICANAE